MADEIRRMVRKFRQHPWDINCGIWFDPAAPENIGCLEDPEPEAA
jgi:hypothetical protein